MYLSENGVYHFEHSAPVEKEQVLWTLTERKALPKLAKRTYANLAIAKSVVAKCFPSETDLQVIDRTQPRTPRHYVLHALSHGVNLKRSDIKKHCIGSHVTTGFKGDVSPLFWKQHKESGVSFDIFTLGILQEMYSGLDVTQANTDAEEHDIMQELCDVLQDTPTQFECRTMLADEYRKAESNRLAEYSADIPF